MIPAIYEILYRFRRVNLSVEFTVNLDVIGLECASKFRRYWIRKVSLF